MWLDRAFRGVSCFNVALVTLYSVTGVVPSMPDWWTAGMVLSVMVAIWTNRGEMGL